MRFNFIIIILNNLFCPWPNVGFFLLVVVQQVGSYLRDLSSLRYVVIDEADRMIEAGHFPEVKSILAFINTPPASVEDLEDNDSNEPEEPPHSKGKKGSPKDKVKPGMTTPFFGYPFL